MQELASNDLFHGMITMPRLGRLSNPREEFQQEIMNSMKTGREERSGPAKEIFLFLFMYFLFFMFSC